MSIGYLLYGYREGVGDRVGYELWLECGMCVCDIEMEDLEGGVEGIERVECYSEYG